MTVNEYQELAMKVVSEEADNRDILINGTMGICSEAGEAINIVKKYLTKAAPLDRSKLVEELGDVAWYIAEVATALGLDLEDVFARNIGKLKMRHPEAFEGVEIERDESRIEESHKAKNEVELDSERIEELLHPDAPGRVLTQPEIDWLISVFDMVKDKLS